MKLNILIDKISKFLATGTYIGYVPLAPGTFGTLWGVIIYFFLSKLSIPLYLIITLSIFLVGVFTSGRVEILEAQKDAGCIVIDEIVGFLIAILALPSRIGYILAAFLVFRFFDIWKPFRWIEALPGGWGVMLDDVLAGLITCLLLHAWRIIFF